MEKNPKSRKCRGAEGRGMVDRVREFGSNQSLPGASEAKGAVVLDCALISQLLYAETLEAPFLAHGRSAPVFNRSRNTKWRGSPARMSWTQECKQHSSLHYHVFFAAK